MSDKNEQKTLKTWIAWGENVNGNKFENKIYSFIRDRGNGGDWSHIQFIVYFW